MFALSYKIDNANIKENKRKNKRSKISDTFILW